MAWIGKYFGLMADVAKDIDGFGAPVWVGALEVLYRCCGHSGGQLSPQCSKRPTKFESQRSPQVPETPKSALEASKRAHMIPPTSPVRPPSALLASSGLSLRKSVEKSLSSTVMPFFAQSWQKGRVSDEAVIGGCW
jgi:hypothetical protein